MITEETEPDSSLATQPKQKEATQIIGEKKNVPEYQENKITEKVVQHWKSPQV